MSDGNLSVGDMYSMFCDNMSCDNRLWIMCPVTICPFVIYIYSMFCDNAFSNILCYGDMLCMFYDNVLCDNLSMDDRSHTSMSGVTCDYIMSRYPVVAFRW